MLKLSVATILMTLCVLTLYGKQRYDGDVLPGEDVTTPADEVPPGPTPVRSVRPVDASDGEDLLVDLREGLPAAFPYEARLRVTIPGFEGDDEWEGGNELFVVRAFSPDDWFVVHHGDERTFVGRSEGSTSFGTGWDLKAWLARGPAGEAGTALTLPSWMLTDEFLQGVDPDGRHASFAFTLQSDPACKVQADVDVETALISSLTLSFSQYVEGVGMQIMDIRAEVEEVRFGDDVEDSGRRPRDAAHLAEVAPLRLGVKPGV